MYYSGLAEADVLNGEGFRTVLFVSGCQWHCDKCQNRNTWDKMYGHPFTSETLDYLLGSLNSPYVTGVTLTGGDPLFQDNLDEVKKIINAIKRRFGNKKSIWMYTGWEYEKLDEKRLNIVSKIDVLIDGPYVDKLRNLNLKWRGSSNQRVIDIPATLKENKIVLLSEDN